MANVKLHLDADTSLKALHKALIERGHDVTRTPSQWMPLAASDEMQLLSTIAHGRCIFTFNIRDFIVLAQRHPHHCGILLAAQKSWTLSRLIKALDRMLSMTRTIDWNGRVCWLNHWG